MQKEIEFDENVVRGEKAAITELRKKVDDNRNMFFRDNKRKAVDDDDMAVTMSNGKKVRNCSRSKPDSAGLNASLSGPTKELLKPCVVRVKNCSRSNPGLARICASFSGPTKECVKHCVVNTRTSRT